MSRKDKGLVPPGMAFIADNIISRNNIMGAEKKSKAGWAKDLDLTARGDTVFFAGRGYQYESGLDSLMSLLRRLDRSPLGAEMPINLAMFQQKIGLDLAGAYRKLTAGGRSNDGRPLVAAVRV